MIILHMARPKAKAKAKAVKNIQKNKVYEYFKKSEKVPRQVLKLSKG